MYESMSWNLQWHSRWKVRRTIYFMRRNSGGGRITLCTQLSIDRLPRLVHLSKTWQGPISAVLHTGSDSYNAIFVQEFAKRTVNALIILYTIILLLSLSLLFKCSHHLTLPIVFFMSSSLAHKYIYAHDE